MPTCLLQWSWNTVPTRRYKPVIAYVYSLYAMPRGAWGKRSTAPPVADEAVRSSNEAQSGDSACVPATLPNCGWLRCLFNLAAPRPLRYFLRGESTTKQASLPCQGQTLPHYQRYQSHAQPGFKTKPHRSLMAATVLVQFSRPKTCHGPIPIPPCVAFRLKFAWQRHHLLTASKEESPVPQHRGLPYLTDSIVSQSALPEHIRPDPSHAGWGPRSSRAPAARFRWPESEPARGPHISFPRL